MAVIYWKKTNQQPINQPTNQNTVLSHISLIYIDKTLYRSFISVVFLILYNFMLLCLADLEGKDTSNSGGCFQNRSSFLNQLSHCWVYVTTVIGTPGPRAGSSNWFVLGIWDHHPQQWKDLPGGHYSLADTLVRQWGYHRSLASFFPIFCPNSLGTRSDVVFINCGWTLLRDWYKFSEEGEPET